MSLSWAFVIFMFLLLSPFVVNGFTAEESKVLSEIAICIVSGRYNWQSFVNTKTLPATQNAAESGLKMAANYKSPYSFDNNDLDVDDMNIIVSDFAGDTFSGFNSVPEETKLFARWEYELLYPSPIKLSNGKYVTQQEIGQWKWDLETPTKVYDIERNEFITYWGDRQMKAERMLKLVEEIETKATANVGSTSKEEILKKQRFTAIKSKLKIGTGVAVGVSAVVNIKLLFSGEILKYFTNVVWDGSVAAACTGAAMGLEEIGLEELAPGVSVIIFGIIDVVKAAKTGDWDRVGLNIVLNSGTTLGVMGGAWGGAQVGTLIGGPIGATVGGIVGGLIGGFGTRIGLGQTPLGQMTKIENENAVKELAKTLDPQLEKFGATLDTSKDFESISESLKEGNIPLRFSRELLEAQAPTLMDIEKLIGKNLVKDLANEASYLNPSGNLLDGLTQLKTALGCD